jgi:uncharacterized protein (DUF2147 family)
MKAKSILNILMLVLVSISITKAGTPPPHEYICGKWMSTEKNLIVEVSIQDNKYTAKIVWFDDGNPKDLETSCDTRNPDPTLRSRKLVGMSVLRGLTYKQNSNSWEDGMIYDASHGHEWNAAAYIDKNGELKVKGYWHCKLIGKTMSFTRYSQGTDLMFAKNGKD